MKTLAFRGLHFKVPGIQDIHVLDVKMQTAHYQNQRQQTENDGVIYQPRIVVLDSKNLNIGIDLTVQFSPVPNEAKDILTNYGINYFEKLIAPIIRDTVRDVVSLFQAEDLAKERSKIAEQLNTRMQQHFASLPFTLHAVQLRNIDLPKIVRDKIEEVQLAKQEEQRLLMIEKQAEKQQHIKTIEANTKLIELTTKAEAEAKQKRLQAEAEAYKIEVQAQAQAKANELLAASLSELIVKYKAMSKMGW